MVRRRALRDHIRPQSVRACEERRPQQIDLLWRGAPEQHTMRLDQFAVAQTSRPFQH
jgi:hypothetical protein